MRVMVVSDEMAERLKEEEPTAIEVPVGADMEALVVKLMPVVPRVPDQGWTEQARRNAQLREAYLTRVRLLDAAQVAELSGSKASNRRALASQWANRRRIFGVRVGTQTLYPEFQFDDAGQPRPGVGKVLELLEQLNLSPWAIALWWDTTSDVLNWRAPANVLVEDPEAVIAAAVTDTRTIGR